MKISKNPITYHCHRCHQTTTTTRKYGLPYYVMPDYCGKCGNPDHDSLPDLIYKPGFDPFTTKNPVTKKSVFQDKHDDWCIDCFSEWATEQDEQYSPEQIVWMLDNKTMLKCA